jgi:hypothetical protein
VGGRESSRQVEEQEQEEEEEDVRRGSVRVEGSEQCKQE